jgi:hypothetical protein
VILLHGGLANTDYWGNQIKALSPQPALFTTQSSLPKCSAAKSISAWVSEGLAASAGKNATSLPGSSSIAFPLHASDR